MSGYKPIKLPPMLSLDSKDLPDVKNWQPGQRYRIILDVEQTNMGLSEDGSTHASFKILNARPQYGSGPVKGSAKPSKSDTMSALAAKAAQ